MPLTVCRVSKAFGVGKGKVDALQDIDLEVSAGEFAAIVRPALASAAWRPITQATSTLPDRAPEIGPGERMGAHGARNVKSMATFIGN
ncbi:hypothetical protein MTR72_15605 [Bradyrhizobium sp. ISRA442]|uniref:hypothetical protein n=1 Tax=Bradyrhizobium sp. ISRA442 TaxID=2866197 RepID=UPI00311B13D7